MSIVYATDLASIKEAKKRIDKIIKKTPILNSQKLDSIAERRLFFKCECFQKSGAFKFRGASNAVLSLDDEEAAKGVVTHSSGNHAAALSLAAKTRGIPAYVVVPNDAPKCKIENIIRYGGRVIFTEPTMEMRKKTTAQVMQETGAVLIESSNNAKVISGQGTIGLELLEQIPELDAIIAPISGAGLVSGVAVAVKLIKPDIRVFAAEPIGANDAALSKENGGIVTLAHIKTIADGLRSQLGHLTWPIVRDFVDEIITVDDAEIVEAMKFCFEILKVVTEPSSATALAAALSIKFKENPKWVDCKNVAVILTGGNVDMDVLMQSYTRKI